MKATLFPVVLATCVAGADTHAITAQSQAGMQLKVVAATSSAVTLSWSAAAGARVVVERKSLGSPWPAPNAKPSEPPTILEGTSTTDNSVAPLGTYVYRVRAFDSKDAAAGPSNEVIVGPPPTGFGQVTLQPVELPQDQFALGLTMVLDANLDPAFAYTFVDPNRDGDAADSTLHFVSWNRALYRWNSPITVATIGAFAGSDPRRGLALARDRTANRFGIAYLVGDSELRVAWSDDGTTWRPVTIDRAREDSTLSEPSIALANGQAFVGYVADGSTIRFRSGSQIDPPQKWKRQDAPKLPDTFGPKAGGMQVAADASGNPAMIYWLAPNSEYNIALAYWRPVANTVVKVTDSNNQQNDSQDSRLIFNGDHPIVMLAAMRDQKFFDGINQVWMVRSVDGGRTWAAPRAMPPDGSHSMGAPLGAAVDSRGLVSAVSRLVSGNSDNVKCGWPKLMREDVSGRLATCAPGVKGSPTGSALDPNVQVTHHDKLYVAFRSIENGGALKAGVILWREP